MFSPFTDSLLFISEKLFRQINAVISVQTRDGGGGDGGTDLPKEENFPYFSKR